MLTSDTGEEEGYDLQMRAYKAAWMKCLDRVRVSEPMSCSPTHFSRCTLLRLYSKRCTLLLSMTL